MSATEPFDMSATIRHPVVVHERIQSVLCGIAFHRDAIKAREVELDQLNEIAYEMLQNATPDVPLDNAEQVLVAAIRGAVRLGLSGREVDSEAVQRHIARATTTLRNAIQQKGEGS